MSYQYRQADREAVSDRVAQFKDQTRRYLAGELSDEEFRPLRLMNGLYVQRLAPMLRIAIPYGLLTSQQMRCLADVSERYDRSYGHFTTRQNIQLNWPQLPEVPDILEELARFDLHAIQTSGNCVRNVTTDVLAGIANDESIDPRLVCEWLRQWSTFHPEFSYLPRKFKIAVTGAMHDRAAIRVHDIGIRAWDDAGTPRVDIYAGGGQGRTPVIAPLIVKGAHVAELIRWCEAIIRVYNQLGNRQNKYKARIKITIRTMGAEAFAEMVREEKAAVDEEMPLDGQIKQLLGISNALHNPVDFLGTASSPVDFADKPQRLQKFLAQNTAELRIPGYRAVWVSLKRPGNAPGDATAAEMRAVADIAERFSASEIRVSHSQNLLLPYVADSDIEAVYQALERIDLHHANVDTLHDMIVCPGLDFCSLANAGTLDVAQDIYKEFTDVDATREIGDISLKMSGCMNACGHHHVGNIGILGVDKKGEQWYQISVGGRADEKARFAKILGPSVHRDKVSLAVRSLVDTYISHRDEDEVFVDTVSRVGIEPFRDDMYRVVS